MMASMMWAKRRRRRGERRAAAILLRNAVVEIRTYAFNGKLYQGPGTVQEYIRMLADTVHNLPGGVLGGGERRKVWPGEGYHTFYWMWTTASPAQKRWLVSQFSAMGYDYTYLEQAGPWPVYSDPATRLSLHRGGLRLPRDVASVKAVDTQTFARLAAQAYERGLTGGKRTDWLITHLDPRGTHILLPKRPGDAFFGPKVDGVWEHRCLLRMLDGAIVVGSLRVERASVDAIPAGLTRREQVRFAALPRRHDRDVGLWGRDHKAAEPDCVSCATAEQHQQPQV
jgi:hypothetical protein